LVERRRAASRGDGRAAASRDGLGGEPVRAPAWLPRETALRRAWRCTCAHRQGAREPELLRLQGRTSHIVDPGGSRQEPCS
jgi:hypothetical protein